MKTAALVLLTLMSALSGCALPGAISGAEAVETSSFGQTEGVDHVLLWTREVEQDTKVLTEKLGFNVIQGGTFPDKIANRLALFRDESNLELLYFTVPLSQVGPDAKKGLSFLAERDGSVGFGIRTEDLDSTAARVASAGLSIGKLSPGDYDPDGPEGPLTQTAIQYRTFGFENAPITGLDPFFVWYAPSSTRTAEGQARREARTTHANTASRLSGVWILTADPAASSAALNKMGFSPGGRIRMPQIGGIATIFTGGRSAILVVEPRGRGVAQEALRSRGPHVLGVSVEVADLETARGFVSRGYGQPLRTYSGAFGTSVLAPAQDDLGVLIEFHVARRAMPPAS